MKQRVLLLVTAFTLAAMVSTGAEKYEANWESLDKRPAPGWFQDAKFGIFIHWGVYAVPSFAAKGNYSEWYWNRMSKKGGDGNNVNEKETWEFHKRTYGEDFQYQQFAPLFKAELYDPDHWAHVFKEAGAKYVVLTSKHHDGFCLWQSEEANRSWGQAWNSVDIGPKRDLLGDLTDSVRDAGLKMGFYYSLYEWFNPLWLQDREAYVNEHMIPQFKDVVTKYKPSIIFSDGEWDMPSKDWKSEELVAWMYNETPMRDELILNDRWGKECRHHHGDYYTTEYTAGLETTDHPWEESRGMGHSYGYNRYETVSDYRSAREMVMMLVDLVSRGGNLLLDIGPTADGRIPVIMEERLFQIGEWLKINGEAIYETRPWKTNMQWSEGEIPKVQYGEEFNVKYEIGEVIQRKTGDQAVVDAFFTRKGDTLYAIAPNLPPEQFTVKGVNASSSTKVTILGTDKTLQWKAAGDDIVIDVPRLTVDETPSTYALTFKITDVE